MDNYQINSSNNSKIIVISPYTTDGPSHPSDSILHENATTASSPLVLLGRGMEKYGDDIAGNFYHLLENFNSVNPPYYPIPGMLWYDTNNIRVFDNNLNWLKIPTYQNDDSEIIFRARLKSVLDPIDSDDVATKQYVDDVYSGGVIPTIDAHATDLSKHLTPIQNTFLDGITVTFTEVNRLSGISGNVQTQLNRKLDTIDGGTISGSTLLTYTPISGNHLVNKSYVDDEIILSTSTLEAHVDDKTVHITTWQNTFLDGLNSNLTSTEVNRLSGISGNVQTQLNRKLDTISGGTISGPTFLTYAPISGNHLANKSYVDDAIIISTGTLETHIYDKTVHITAWQNTFLDGLNVNLTSTEVNSLRGVTSNVQPQLNSRLKLSGGTLSGPVFATFTPTDPQHIITKSFVDSKKYIKEFVIADWITNTITVTDTDHQLGETKYLSVGVYEAGTPNLKVYTDVTISSLGEVIIAFTTPFDGYLIIS